MICNYKGYIFLWKSKRFMGREGDLTFLEKFDGTKGEYRNKYHKLYPYDRKSIYGDGLDLPRYIRRKIENSIEYLSLIRDETIDQILENIPI